MARYVMLVGATTLLVSGLAMVVAPTKKKEAEAGSSAKLIATYYGPGFEGSPTASGETFNPQAMTAAHPSLPFGTLLTVCKKRCAQIKINDRGPFGSDANLDLSEGAAQRIGLVDEGKGSVTVVDSPTPTTEAPAIPELPKTGGVR